MNKFGQGAGVLSNAAFLELFSGSDKAHLDLSFRTDVVYPNKLEAKAK